MSVEEQSSKLARFLMENFPKKINLDKSAEEVAIKLLEEEVLEDETVKDEENDGIDFLKSEVDKLQNLLEAPHVGLASWNACLEMRIKEILKYLPEEEVKDE